MKAASVVRIVDHDGYEKIHRVGEVGKVTRLKEKRVWVKFDGEDEDVEYPVDLVQELTEEEQAQLKGGGKDGTPDTSKPKPPEVRGEEMDDLEGEQKQVPQAAGGGERPGGGGQGAGVSSDQVTLKGEQGQVEQPAGGPERPTGSGQSAGVRSDQLVMRGQQPQLTGAGSKTEGTQQRGRRGRVKEQGPQEGLLVSGKVEAATSDSGQEMLADMMGGRAPDVDVTFLDVEEGGWFPFTVGFPDGENREKFLALAQKERGWVTIEASEGGPAPSSGVVSRTEATGRRGRVKEGVFHPIAINVLEEGDKEDEYVTLGEGSSIRSEHHLWSAIRGAVRKAMEGMQRPFDVVDVVFRRAPVQEEKRRKAERQVLATLYLLDEGKAKSADVRKAAKAAARLGVKVGRLAEYTDDRYAKKILKEQSVGGAPKVIWPPKELAKHVGAHVIVETRTGDRLVGTLAKGPGARLFNVKTRSGTHRFSPADVIRILVKPGAK